MSALDQAITKAYAKDRPRATIAQADPPLEIVAAPPAACAPPRAASVEQLYRDGALYRVEHAAGVGTTSNRNVPRPHVPPLPPTSPRRNVRRSMLRLLAAESPAPAVETSEASPPRIARKVIIRHVSHAATPAPLGLRQPETERQPAAPPVSPTPPVLPAPPTADLPPEKLDEGVDPPPASFPSPAAPKPAEPPLNIEWEQAPALQIYGRWLHEGAIAPLVMISDAQAAKEHPAFAECVVQVDALAAAHVEAAALAANQPKIEPSLKLTEPKIHAKAPGDLDPPRPKVYFDSPHTGTPRAHARFVPAAESAAESLVKEATSPVGESETPAEPPPPSREIEAPPDHESAPIEHIIAAAEALPAVEEVLASDLIPAAPIEPVEPEPPSPAPTPEPQSAPRTAIPVWEVDRFQWPKTCDKLMADRTGYLATAGDRLLAAAQDGLRVLAITGTRRGEGRTTMTLCLARAAARAGLQVAIMDADFARPQIASKLGLETAHGWQDAALGKIPLSEAAVKSLADEITVLPLESSSVVRRLSLADPRVTATIRAVAATFELVILDLGPIQAGEQLAFPHAERSPLDAAIVVRDVRFASVVEGESVGHMLQDLGVEAVGIAENFVIDDEIPATSV